MKRIFASLVIAGLVFSSVALAAEVTMPGGRLSVLKKEPLSAKETIPNVPNAEFGFAPRVTVAFASTITGGRETQGVMTWKDPDNKVTKAFLTVFFQDGDVGQVTLWDTRDGDLPASGGRITFGITPTGYRPNLGSNGVVIVTVTDQDYNTTQMTTTFLVRNN